MTRSREVSKEAETDSPEIYQLIKQLMQKIDRLSNIH